MSSASPSVGREVAQRPVSPTVVKGKTGYGIDEPRSILELAVAGVLAIAVGFVLSAYTSRTDPGLARLGLLIGPGVGFLVLAVATALYWSSQQGKVTEMMKMISEIPWGGNEVVLDIGCGRGLGMVMAGRRLEGGYSIGVDLWQKSHLSGNRPSSIWANAAKEGVVDRVGPVKADTLSLPLSDSSVDVILSALSLHRLIKKKDRVVAFREIARVLKQGGRIGIIDAGGGGEYAKVLREIGMSDISVRHLRFSSFPPFHVVHARKPFQG
jgi:arsenite methyltransferase